jgi:hypothetical protein
MAAAVSAAAFRLTKNTKIFIIEEKYSLQILRRG